MKTTVEVVHEVFMTHFFLSTTVNWLEIESFILSPAANNCGVFRRSSHTLLALLVTKPSHYEYDKGEEEKLKVSNTQPNQFW